MSLAAYSQHGSSHGQFSPWALIQAPGPTRAFRFVYPTLASAAWNRHYVWDVRTGELEQEVVDQNLGELQAQVHYVEVTDKYVILCRSYAIHIYSRSDGRRVLEIDSRSSLRECHLLAQPLRRNARQRIVTAAFARVFPRTKYYDPRA